MSLINDALKKAERARAGGNGPLPAATAGTGLQASPARPTPPPTVLLVAGGAVLGLALALGAWLLWPTPPSPSLPDPALQPVETPLPTPASPPVALASAPTSPPDSVGSSPVPATASPSASLPPAAIAAVPVAGNPTQPVATEPGPAGGASAASGNGIVPGPAAPSARFVQRAESFRVVGIRFAGADSKVIMNDRVYRIGETVDHEQGIRLTAVTADTLSFVDATGAAYTRRF